MTDQRIDRAVAWAVEELTKVGIDNARREARLLLAHHLGQTVEQIIAFPERTVMDFDGFRGLIGRRCKREPLSHITGTREFWSLSFEVSKDVLIPRPDSETLVEAVLAEIIDRDAALRLVDFGTGSGCLILSLLSELPNATGLAVDISGAALAIAARNAANLGLANRCDFLLSDWTDRVTGEFDIALSNPPYIETHDIRCLEPEVAEFDPLSALDGGEDGLHAYRILIPQIRNILKPEGFTALELGQGQADAVTGILQDSGFHKVIRHRDLGGIDRCLTGHMAERG